MVLIPVQDDNPLKWIRFQWVTVGLITVNALVYLAENTELGQKVAASFALIPFELFYAGLLGGPAFGPDDYWPIAERTTLVSYMFLHGDILHLASNMLFLWVFGDNVEDALGHAKFLVFYLACGVLAGLTHAFALSESRIPLIGASGAVAGIIAAYVMLHPTVRVWVLVLRILPLRIPAWLVLGSWIAVQIAMVVAPPGKGPTAWFAHIGGLTAGGLLVLILRRKGVPLFDRPSDTALEPPLPTSPSAQRDPRSPDV
jgi:membrane associated rhomboid family serine protease